MIYELTEKIDLMCLKSQNGPLTASKTFDELENDLHSLKGRHFYGLFRLENNEETYLACTRIEENDKPEELNFLRITISPGKYDRERLEDWVEKWQGSSIKGLPELFELLEERNEGNIDLRRYSVEYYRSQKELIAMLPLKE